MGDIEDDVGASPFFQVEIDGETLGYFTGCKGLGCEVEMESRTEGGNQFFVHQLPGHMKFGNVTLTRPVGSFSATMAAYVSKMAASPKRTTGKISIISHNMETVASWGLLDVMPVKWTGPQLDSASGGGPAMETLELAHQGFFEPGLPG